MLSGEFTIVNQHLLHDLNRLGLWSPDLKNELVAANGSVADIDMPDNLKELYKTVWEIKQRTLVDMAADRGAFIDQVRYRHSFVRCRNVGTCKQVRGILNTTMPSRSVAPSRGFGSAEMPTHPSCLPWWC